MDQLAPSATTPATPNPHTRNQAIQRCCDARDRSLEESFEQGLSSSQTKERAEKAYRDALPDLTGYENIRDFIACIAHGVLTGDIHPIEGPRHFYAAQVAISALRLEPKEKKPKNKKITKS